MRTKNVWDSPTCADAHSASTQDEMLSLNVERRIPRTREGHKRTHENLSHESVFVTVPVSV